MSRKLATLRYVTGLFPIEGADKIELAQIDGWQCIVGKGEFELGDFGVFFEIDSFLPIEERYSFLPKNIIKSFYPDIEGYRIKTIKMKGVQSQGLLMPLHKFPEVFHENIWERLKGLLGFKKKELLYHDRDVTNLLGVLHYDHLVEAAEENQTRKSPFSNQPRTDKPFPSFIPKTDEERIQNMPWLFSDKYKEKLNEASYYITEKLDGTSFTAYYNDGTYGVCSRNRELSLSEPNLYSDFFHAANVKKFLDLLSNDGRSNVAIQGELVGPGVQGNSLNLTERKLYLFNIYDINKKVFERPRYRGLLFDSIEFVPGIETTTKFPFASMEEALGYAKGKSVLNPNEDREGVVVRHYDKTKLSFKVINNDWLLKRK